MAKTNASSELQTVPGPLPLPEVALMHHGNTLFVPMKQWELKKQIPPVILLSGQPGIGKRSMAYFLGQWILCQSRSHQQPCGECPSCQQCLAGNHVDFTEIQEDPETDHTKGALKIEQFRKLKTSAGFGAEDGKYRITLIPNAERMTPQAANSVLKILEEPPRGWIFILTTSDPALLLPTLVSRCQAFRLKPFSPQQLGELLRPLGLPASQIEVSTKLAHGSWRRAIDFSSDAIWEQRKTVLRFFREPASALQALLDWAAQESAHFEILLDFMEENVSNLIRWSLEENSVIPQAELAEHTERISKKRGSISSARAFWIERSEDIAWARRDALTSANKKLILQNLLLPWTDVAL